MEAIVSAAVLVIVALGVLAAMDAVSGTAGANKARTVAATLAEEDQERLRGMKTVSISGHQERRTIPAAGVNYTVDSKAEWIRDATGETVSCTSEEGQVNYLRITSTVTSPATGAAVKPVVLSSLVAPPAGALGTSGTLAVSVVNAAGLPVMNLPVALSGTAARTGTTNAEGCAIFSLLPAGSYTVTLNQGGWVDKAGKRLSTKPGVTVTAGNVSTVSMEYDRAASLTVLVETLKSGATAPGPDKASSLIGANTGIQPSGFTVLKPQVPASTIDVGGLFPFTDPYTFYSGACQGNDPSLYVPGYFDSNSGVIQLSPGLHGGTVKVREPAINIEARRNGRDWAHGSPWDNATHSRARIYPRIEGCATTPIDVAPLAPGGTLPDPGLPFGEYTVCVQDHQGRHDAVTVVNGDPAGTPVQELWIDPSARNGSCEEALG